MPNPTSDVIVVGAGIIGLACAHSLLAAGLSVRLVERHLPGAGQSTRTGGGLRYWHGSETNIRLSEMSLSFWEQFGSITGIDPDYRQTGHLFLTSDKNRADQLTLQASLLRRLDVPHDLLDQGDFVERWPFLDCKGAMSAGYCETGGYLDHHRAIAGYQRLVASLGGEINTGTRVDGLGVTGDRVTSISTSRGEFEADWIINAAGPDAGAVARMAGVTIPFVSRRHELLIIQPARPVPDETPWLIDMDEQVHLRPDGQGRALVGGFLGRDDEADPVDYDTRACADWSRRVRRTVASSFGLTEPDANVIEGWAGLYPGTPDYQPVLEITRPGLITAAGFSGTGLMHAPAVGEIVADLVTTGKTIRLDISGMNAERLRQPAVIKERTGF